MYHYVGLRTGCGRCVRCERWLLGQRCLHVSSHRTAMPARFVTQDNNVYTFRNTGQQCLHVSSHRTAMSARFVTQDSDVCTFRHTGQRCLHVSSHRTTMSARFVTQDSDVCTFRHTGQGAIVPFIFVLSLFLSFLFLFIWTVDISTV